VDIVCTVTLPYCGFSVEVFLCYESRGACSVGVSKYMQSKVDFCLNIVYIGSLN
jgi:hypothetical protein